MTRTTEQIASEINADLQQLYQNLRAVFEPQDSNPISQWEYESEDNWEDDNNKDTRSDLSPP
jgi:hypothetical protein